MVLILKGRRAALSGALRALDFATTRCPAAADRVVDAAGLGAVFGALMGRLRPKAGASGAARRDEAAAREDEERAASIVSNLFQARAAPRPLWAPRPATQAPRCPQAARP
jgi:beta-catenin-like protein 1